MSCARRNAWAACGSGLKTPFSPSGLRGSPHAYNSQLVAELLISPSDAHPTEHIEKIRRDFKSLTNGSLLWDKRNGCMLQPNQRLLDRLDGKILRKVPT